MDLADKALGGAGLIHDNNMTAAETSRGCYKYDHHRRRPVRRNHPQRPHQKAWLGRRRRLIEHHQQTYKAI